MTSDNNNLDIVQRLTTVEGKLDSIAKSVDEMKAGLWHRVETDGKDIAVIKEQMRGFVKSEDFTPVKEVVGDLTASKKWLITAIVGGFLSSLWAMMKK